MGKIDTIRNYIEDYWNDKKVTAESIANSPKIREIDENYLIDSLVYTALSEMFFNNIPIEGAEDALRDMFNNGEFDIYEDDWDEIIDKFRAKFEVLNADEE